MASPSADAAGVSASPSADAAGVSASPSADATGWDDLLATMEADLATILDRREAAESRRGLAEGDREASGNRPVVGGNSEVAEPWNAPSGLGPMPEHLAPRAQRLLAHLGDGIRRLEAERTTVSDHLAVLRTLPATSGESPAVYLDVKG